MVSDDGKLALCQRVSNNHPNKKGGWWHSLEDRITGQRSIYVSRIDKLKASADTLHTIYSKLFQLMPLSVQHLQVLKNRGLTEREIVEHGYGTLPIQNRHKAARALANQFGEDVLSSTPGFYVKEGPYGEYWTVFGGTGFMIPILSIDRKIIGIQVRVDQPTRNTKYIWLSTDGRKNGTSSGNPVHVAIPPVIESNDIWITEGPLKANVIAWRKKCVSLAAPGIAHWIEIPDLVKAVIDRFNLTNTRSVIAYDAEFDIKPWVKDYAYALALELKNNRLAPYFASWNRENGKGIDDLIIQNKAQSCIVKYE